ncbi:2-phospho-L-lactate transferase [Aestuariicella hydrocarbonica]|uniref:2-phospho-L-lactate transferase n=1 Tax=Pseudomaricurvus hydrocarbonicus TaxID=1470433 RepID=A0A9E5MM16_9GAMM|nr:2-phospho-L-lactate transferase [Aestuariicella hydrocarbonica]NHO66023.1 2-phospho-L-lactate transferase [Aestuariicella hydrocarbonica]
MSTKSGPVVVLSGGVGGAKLALGLYRILPEQSLSVVVNTGDDFNHYGLRICPDLDTALYTLADLSDKEQGWGRANESWQCLQTLAELGGDNWFRLGDRDLALHLLRTQHLSEGATLTQCIHRLAANMGIGAQILPMSDQVVATELATDQGRLPFQEYFVRRQCQPVVESMHYTGAEVAQPSDEVLSALAQPDLRAIVIAPSNPYLSVAPILSIVGMKAALQRASAPVIAVSPVIGGAAVKGPTAKIMQELNLQPSALTVANFYKDLIDGFVLDTTDESLLSQLPVAGLSTNTLMTSLPDRERLAEEVLGFADQLR